MLRLRRCSRDQNLGGMYRLAKLLRRATTTAEDPIDRAVAAFAARRRRSLSDSAGIYSPTALIQTYSLIP
jgi:hypothetical protein